MKRGAFGFDDFVALLGSDQGVLAGNGVGVFGEEAGRFGGLFGVGVLVFLLLIGLIRLIAD